MTQYSFDKLIQSTESLHERFGTAQSIELALTIAQEEWYETFDAACAIEDAITPDTEHLAHETADLIVTLIGLAHICGVSNSQLEQAMLAVAAKNDSKVPGVTHAINPVTRKIERIK